jgi:hypothetical protein
VDEGFAVAFDFTVFFILFKKDFTGAFGVNVGRVGGKGATFVLGLTVFFKVFRIDFFAGIARGPARSPPAGPDAGPAAGGEVLCTLGRAARGADIYFYQIFN